MTKKFKVVAGTHYGPNPGYTGTNPHDSDRHKVYRKGDIVESEDEKLHERFVNQFEPLHEPEPVVVSEERKAAVSTLIAAGAWSEEDRKFLEELPEDGFRRIDRRFRETKSPASGADEDKPQESVLGEDVTGKFERAGDSGLRVWRNRAGKHQVTKAEGPRKPLNPQPLSANQVNRFVSEYLEEAKKDEPAGPDLPLEPVKDSDEA